MNARPNGLDGPCEQRFLVGFAEARLRQYGKVRVCRSEIAR
jgi:hypothetical protein